MSPSPKMIIRTGPPPQSSHPPPPHHHTQAVPTPSQYIPPLPIPSGGTSSSYPSHQSKASNVKRKKVGGGGYNFWANSRIFSGFKTLNSLALMGLSSLECLGEIADCIKASSSTLNSLTLSLSTELARKARKPVAVNPELEDPSDTELDEDEMLNDPMPPSSTVQPVTNEADIRKERLAQESILARIFDLQSVSAEGKRLEKKLSVAVGRSIEEEERHATTRKLGALMKSLMDAPPVSDDASSHAGRLEHFRMVRDVADMYITTQTTQKKALKEHNKVSLPPAKKSEAVPKITNPATLGLEPSASSSSVANMMEWDLLGSLSNSKHSLFEPGLNESFSNGVSKSYISGEVYSPNDASVPSTLGSSKTSKVTQVQQMLLQAQQLAQHQAHLAAQVQAHKAQIASTPASFGGTSNNSASSTTFPLVYEQSHPGSPGSYHDDSMFSPYHPYLNSYSNGSLNQYLNEDVSTIVPKNQVPYITKKAKTKAPATKKSGASKVIQVDDEDDSDTLLKTPISTQQPFFAADPASELVEDSMDVDMVHPDEDIADLGEDQEIVAGAEDGESSTPRKRAKIGEVEGRSASDVAGKETFSPQNGAIPELAHDPIASEEAMQSYIRATHGLRLEALSLEWVPLKASIVARALDLSVLKRLTLLEVGSQDALWTLLARLQGPSTEIGFRSVHTDNVSLPFITFLATFKGLEELYMHERSSKQDTEAAISAPVNITIVRKMALQKHMPTLKRLMIKNDRNDTWDVDAKTLQFLAYRGAGLIELGISLNMKTYVSPRSSLNSVILIIQHMLMQLFYGFKNLYALYLINLRSGDRSATLQSESLSFAVDSLSHCPDMKVKYIALVSQVVMLETRPPQFNKALQLVLEKRNKDKKGKGKAVSDAINTLMEAFEDSDSDGSSEVQADVLTGDHKIRFTSSFAVAADVKIFTREIRLGKF